MKIGYRAEKPLYYQANDFKRALCGRQPTSLIASILFVLCCFNLFCRYLSKYDAKKRKLFEAVDQKPNPHHTKKQKKTFIFQKVGTARACGGTARACGGTAVPTHQPKKKNSTKKKTFFFFSLIQKNTTFFILQKLHNINIQTSISISIHHCKHKPQSKPTFIHPNTKFGHH